MDRTLPTSALGAWRWVRELCARSVEHGPLVGWGQAAAGRWHTRHPLTWPEGRRPGEWLQVTCRADDHQGGMQTLFGKKNSLDRIPSLLDTLRGENTHLFSMHFKNRKIQWGEF